MDPDCVSTQKQTTLRPETKSDRFKNVFVNRLILKYNLCSVLNLFFFCILYVLRIFSLPTVNVT